MLAITLWRRLKKNRWPEESRAKRQPRVNEQPFAQHVQCSSVGESSLETLGQAQESARAGRGRAVYWLTGTYRTRVVRGEFHIWNGPRIIGACH